jgi:hypothetical protein
LVVDNAPHLVFSLFELHKHFYLLTSHDIHSSGNDLARCLHWGGGYEGESIPKLLEKLARADTVMMDRWTISIETKSDKDESIAIPSHKVLKVSEPVESFHSLRILICLNQFTSRQGNSVGKCSKSR